MKPLQTARPRVEWEHEPRLRAAAGRGGDRGRRPGRHQGRGPGRVRRRVPGSDARHRLDRRDGALARADAHRRESGAGGEARSRCPSHLPSALSQHPRRPPGDLGDAPQHRRQHDGSGNAATPFGIKAMEELEKLNPTPGTATNAQVLFLAINTASLQLVPTTVIALRASAQSSDPAGILLPTLIATVCALTVAILAAKLLERVWK